MKKRRSPTRKELTAEDATPMLLSPDLAGEEKRVEKSSRRCNDLDGRDWTRFSLSVWNDIRWTAEEQQLTHPAMFPTMLVERIIRCFTRADETRILDPFLGSGSALIAARNQGRQGIGFEVYDKFVKLAERRLGGCLFADDIEKPIIHTASAHRMLEFVEPNSIDLCVTSPPYWDILTEKRTADYKETRHYGENTDDLGRIESYDEFLDSLAKVFAVVLTVLKPGKYCVINVMDLRKKDVFFPLHSDLAARMKQMGYVFDDLIIWDRRQEYNNLRCLGFPYTFRVNKIHEFVMIFRKPKSTGK